MRYQWLAETNEFFYILQAYLSPGIFKTLIGTVKQIYMKLSWQIHEIILSDIGYNGPLTDYAADIAILRTEKKISISSAVLPACLQLDKSQRFEPSRKALGKVIIYFAPFLVNITVRESWGWSTVYLCSFCDRLQRIQDRKIVGSQFSWKIQNSQIQRGYENTKINYLRMRKVKFSKNL